MLSLKQLAETIGDRTRVKILILLSEKKLTTTEIFKQMPEIKYRESIHKALKKLEQSGLIKRKFDPKVKGYKHFTAFKKIQINYKLEITME